MPLLHDAWRREQTNLASNKERFGIAVTEGLEFAEPTGKHRRDVVERQLGLNLQHALRIASREALGGMKAETPLQFRQPFGRQCESNREGVTAKTRKEIGAGLNGFEQRKAVDRSPGAVSDTVLHADYEHRLGGALHHTRGENADDAAMPAISVEHEQAFAHQSFVTGEALFDCGEHVCFRLATVAIEPLQLRSQFLCPLMVARGEELDYFRGDVHAPGCVDARRNAKGDVEAGELLRCGIKLSRGKERTEPDAYRPAQFAQTESSDGAILSAQWDRIGNGGNGGHLQKAGQYLFASARGIAAFKDRLCQLECDRRTAKRLFRIGAAGLVGVENGERIRKRIVRVGQMVIG